MPTAALSLVEAAPEIDATLAVADRDQMTNARHLPRGSLGIKKDHGADRSLVTAEGYTATTARSGSIVRTRFSMAPSVPEIELGQLPHAPW